MRAVIYARYSSENQRDASIADQVRVCRDRIEREGWRYLRGYTDRAVSGASTLRPGYHHLLADARDGAFDVVVAEALDRLSRDQEDIAALFERLSFLGIRIVTLADRDISELHVGIKDTMNALFLKDLADKTRRSLRGRIEQGRSGGGRCYGYAVHRDGEERGLRRIVEGEAAVVRRISALYAGGSSPRAIARRLNAEGVPAPDGRPWGDTTIRGHALRGTGILRNEFYVGRLIWNRQRYVKDPLSGRRISRANPREAWVIEPVPALRILGDALRV